MIAAAGYLVLKSVMFGTQDNAQPFQWIAFALFVVLFALLRIKPLQRIHPIVYIAAGAVLRHCFATVATAPVNLTLVDFAPIL